MTVRAMISHSLVTALFFSTFGSSLNRNHSHLVGGLGGLGLWPEYSAAVGHPTSTEPTKDSATGVYSRPYSASIAFVNPSNASQVVALPAQTSGWKDLYGASVPDPKKVVLPPASGLVFLKA